MGKCWLPDAGCVRQCLQLLNLRPDQEPIEPVGTWSGILLDQQPDYHPNNLAAFIHGI